ncbi:hypothetical protein D3C84_714550 [compost metagenome]
MISLCRIRLLLIHYVESVHVLFVRKSASQQVYCLQLAWKVVTSHQWTPCPPLILRCVDIWKARPSRQATQGYRAQAFQFERYWYGCTVYAWRAMTALHCRVSHWLVTVMFVEATALKSYCHNASCIRFQCTIAPRSSNPESGVVFARFLACDFLTV